MKISIFQAVSGLVLLSLGSEVVAAGFKVNAFYQGNPLANANVIIDDEVRGVTTAAGDLLVENLSTGRHRGSIDINGKSVPFRFSIDSDNQIAVFSVAIDRSGKKTEKLLTVGADEIDAITGTVKGRILSSETDEPVANAKVSIAGTVYSTESDQDGNFELELTRGSYSLQVKRDGYASQRLEGVVVMPGLTADLELQLHESLGTGAMEEVSVVARYVADNATASMREASTIINMIDREQLARFGDSTVADALRRVSGVSLQEGKYVQVRGMSGRYVSTTLNGARLPSTDVLQRVVPMDMFPTGVIDHIEVQKSFSPDHFGEGGAGSVNLVTRGIPDAPFVKIKGDIAHNNKVTGKQVASHEGGDDDWLGFDDGTRDMPDAVSDWLKEADNDYISERPPSVVERDKAIGEAFLEPRYAKADPNSTLELSAGNSWQINATEFGYVFGARYKNGWKNDIGEEGRYYTYTDERTTPPTLLLARDLDASFQRGTNEIAISTVLALGLKFGEDHEITSNTLLLRNSSKDTKNQVDSENGGESPFYSIEIDWEERQILGQQLHGTHFFPDLLDLDIQWQATWSEASRDVPNAWEYEYEIRHDGPYQRYQLVEESGSLNRPQVFWQEMDDENITFGVDFKLPFSFNFPFTEGMYVENQLKWGASIFRRDRDAISEEWRGYGCSGTPSDDISTLLDTCEWKYEGHHADNDLNPTKDTTREAVTGSNYIANWDMDAYYLMAETNFQDVVEIMLGVRWEDSRMELTPEWVPDSRPKSNQIDNKNKMPAANLTWHILEDLQLRMAYSRTYTIPDFVEVADMRMRDPFSDGTIIGNPKLKQTRLVNYDTRLEWYFSPTEIISLALFKKEITDAIEKVNLFRDDFSYQNYDGTNKGFELEVRKEFSLDEDQNHDLFVQANYGWIDSEVEVPPLGDTYFAGPRPLVDQPEKLMNLQIGYDHNPSAQDVTLIFNYVGEKLEAAATKELMPHIFQQPYLDVRLKYKVTFYNSWEVSATISNLLDEEKEYLQGGEVFRRYKSGREIKIGTSYEF